MTATHEASDVWTVDELAAYMRLDRKTVYSEIRRGKIPGCQRIGAAIRVHRPTVVRWLAEGQGCVSRSPRRLK
jgi:excisionase family DNA binding protein